MAALVALLAAAWLSPSAEAGAAAPNPYVALGDSVAAGAGAAPGEGYVDLLFSDYTASLGADELLNRSQGGESSTRMIEGGQLDTALADIDAASDTRAVTIDIGGNDYLNFDCRSDWDDPSRCPFRANLATALDELEQALANDPGEEPFTVMTYYNPGAGTLFAGRYDAELLGDNGRVACTDSGPDVGLNDVILQEAATLGIALADPYPAFEAAGQSLMSADGIHPNTAGHQAIAEAFGDASVPQSCGRTPGGDERVEGSASAARTQSMSSRFPTNRKKVAVAMHVRAAESLTAKAQGKVELGDGLYRLKPKTKACGPDEIHTVKLKPTKQAQRKIAKALHKGRTARARLEVVLTDEAGNTKTEKLRVRLVR
jgi:lysophospholipase L1-like esterase